MPTNENQFEEYQNWASTGGGEGDPVESTSDIETYVEGLLASVGSLYNDEALIPSSASERQNGAGFLNVNDLVDYLEGGALILWDVTGNPIPNPIVHILKRFDNVQQTVVYDIWIDDET